MKDIGEFLKSSRIDNGVSLEEAAEDLNLTVVQLENIEDGNIRAFKDVYALRELVKNYGKYLGVETDSILDEFNDFMFEHTSKISLEDIKEARQLLKEKEEDAKPKIVSPYTNIRRPKIRLDQIKIKPLIISITIIVFLIIAMIIWIKVNDKSEIISSELLGNMEDVYEFTY